MRSHGLELPATALFGLAATGEIHLTTPERCSLALLSLDRERFLQWAVELGERASRSSWKVSTGRRSTRSASGR